ncbi:MAG TPA: sigma-70 family RNA polymerase sigma factor [Pirellulales bacterium]|jgi:RNA polymerase sigma-70 factor (ECF subfamily)|nr:sigma-70 family RNA polymerase sigma factor [Pirellulales bacterium]
MDSAANAESELAARLRAGDPSALAELFDQHRERLWRLVNFRLDHRLLGRVDADDLLQESYLAAAKRIAHFGANPALSPFVWLRLVVCQTLVDLHRHHLGAQQRSAGREVDLQGGPWSQTTSAALANQLVGNFTSPSQVVSRAEMVQKVEQAIGQMNPTDQEILALRHFEELTNSEVAEALGIEQKAASIRYVRALNRLQAILAEVPGLLNET